MEKAIELTESFKTEFINGSTAEAKREMAEYIQSTAKELNFDPELITTYGGYYLIICNEEGERLYDPIWEGNQNYPTRINTFEVYKFAKENGLKNFKIHWQTDGRYYETYTDKRAGIDIPLGDGTNTLLLKNK